MSRKADNDDLAIDSGDILLARKAREIAEIAAQYRVPLVMAIGSNHGCPDIVRRVGDERCQDLVLKLAVIEADIEQVIANG